MGAKFGESKLIFPGNVVSLLVHIVEVVYRWVELIDDQVQIDNVQKDDVATCDESEHLLAPFAQDPLDWLFDGALIAAVVHDVDPAGAEWDHTRDDDYNGAAEKTSISV